MNAEYYLREGLVRIWYLEVPGEDTVQYRLASYNGVKLDEIATTLRPLCYDANFVRRWGTRCDTNDEIDELHSSYAGYLRQTVMENTLAMQQECADH